MFSTSLTTTRSVISRHTEPASMPNSSIPSATERTNPLPTSWMGETFSRNMTLPDHAIAPAEVRAGCSDHPSAQLPSDIGRFGYADERIRQQQPAGRVLPAHPSLDGRDLARPHVDLGQIVEHRGVAVDHFPKMQFERQRRERCDPGCPKSCPPLPRERRARLSSNARAANGQRCRGTWRIGFGNQAFTL